MVTLATSAAFIGSLGLGHGRIVLGLLIGGLLAAPLAGWLVRHVPARPLMALVGLLIIGLSGYGLWSA